MRRLFIWSLAAILLLSACSSTGTKDAGQIGSSAAGSTASPQTSAVEPPLEITVMLPDYDVEKTPKPDSPVIQEIEKYTNTKLKIEWVPSSSYNDKFNITLASGRLPTLIVVLDRSSSFINAVRAGAFWELGPYLKDYPNLSKANSIVLNNISVDGKIYGIYRSRALGRNGVSIRKDWLENLGLGIPKTIDEFYNVLKAFTTQDPDRNGKNDTYGMVVTKYNGTWDIMSAWFGVPNKWREEADGQLMPAHLTPEYMDALRFFKKLYDEKLINADFAVMDPAKWNDPVLAGKAGVIVDVTDRAQRLEESMHKSLQAAGKDDPNKQFFDVFGGVEGPKGLRILATSGYNGQIVVSKSSVPTEKELRRVLRFLDQMNDESMQIMAANGIEGRHYKKVDGGIEPTTDPALVSELESLNQLLMFIPEDRSLKVKQTPIRQKVVEVQKANEPHVVANPAEPLISNTYAQKGAQLDTIVNDARTKYIVGQLDEAGFQKEIDRWRQNGGDEYIREINELYRQAKANSGR